MRKFSANSNDIATNAKAFTSTFLFFAPHKTPAKKIKKNLQANTQRQTVMDRHSTTKKNNEPLTAPKKNGGRSAYTNIVQLIKFGGYRQFSVPNPPLLLAANR